MSDSSFYDGGAVRESATIPKEDLLTLVYKNKNAAILSPEENMVFQWFFKYSHYILYDDYIFYMPGIKAVLDWACTDRKPEPYPTHNWVLGMPYSECIRSMLRHKEKIRSGEYFDKDSGLPHEFHAQCNLYYLVLYVATKTGKDDRYSKPWT